MAAHKVKLGMHLFLAILLSFATGTAASVPQSVFSLANNALSFGLSLSDTSQTIYFALSGLTTNTWTAIGINPSSGMKGALVLMAYPSANGASMTLSPRISTGSNEPTYNASLDITVLSQSVSDTNKTFLITGQCTNCRQWSNDRVLGRSSGVGMMYGIGPEGDYIHSDDPAISLPYHARFGFFSMDTEQAMGSNAGVPDLTVAGGTTAGKDHDGQSDIVIPIHGIIMVVVFFALFPAAILILAVAEKPRLYVIFQAIFAVIAVVGFACGCYDSTYYNKTKNFSTAHQIVGLLVLAIMVITCVIGGVYFPRYRRKLATRDEKNRSVLGYATHILGMLTLMFGCVDAFLGFPLAFEPDKNKIIGGVFAAMVVILYGSLFWKRSRAGDPRG